MEQNSSHTISTVAWYVYIVKCIDNSLYTGVTTDPNRRLKEHNSSPGGARYTRARRPVTLVYIEHHPTRSAACKREYAIKQLSRPEKEALIATRKPYVFPEPINQ